MRRLTVGGLTVMGTLFVAILAPGASAVTAGHGTRTLYEVTQLGSLGGSNSAGSSINNRGWVTGFSTLPQDQTMHAALWRDDNIIDLRTLGGPNTNSAVLWPVKNNTGVIVGVTETAEIDPLGESWSCSFFFPSVTGNTCLGFVWQDGEMKPLPTLGGNNGFATGANNRGEVVGWAETTFHDPTCNGDQVLQFHATLWDTRDDTFLEASPLVLPPLATDSVSSATAINDQGQVVGISGICDVAVGRFSAAHAVLWEDGVPTDIGDLGGVAWNTPMAINHRGEVVGFANVPGGEDPGDFHAHAFRWTEAGGIEDLGTLPGAVSGDPDDAISQALGINGQGQVVGMSCGVRGCRGFIWQDGVMTNLNSLLAPDYGGHLVYANDINDAGQITGQAIDPVTGDAVAFVATPFGGGS
jgi:probable HAF family extracellular repeat protein